MFYVRVGLAELVGFRRGTQGEVFQFGGLCEEGVIELDDATGRTVVRAECLDGELLVRVWELLLDVIQQTPVARAPTVDTLFDIAHNKVARLLVTHRLVE